MMGAPRPYAGERTKSAPWRRAAAGIFAEVGAVVLYLMVLLGLCAVVSRL